MSLKGEKPTGQMRRGSADSPEQGQRAESPAPKAGYKTAICLPVTPKSVLAFREASIQNDMDVFIGLDVSLASTAICVLGEKGKIVTEAQVASTPESLVVFMHKLPHGIAAIGLEAGPLSHWLHKGLSDAGFE